MDRRVKIALAAATLALAGCNQKNEPAQTNVSDNAISTNVSSENASSGMPTENGAITSEVTSGQTFANTAAASDAFEIASSKLALTRATSDAVKTFAQKMIDVHTASTAKVKAAAASANPAITPDATLSKDQQQEMSALQSASKSAFDAAYIDDQVSVHQAALGGLKNYASNGDVEALKSVATQLVPIVTAHLNAAQALKH